MSDHESTTGGGDAEAQATLGRFAATLRTAAVWEQPPDGLADRVIAQVGALRAGDGHGDRTNVAEAASVDDSHRRRPGTSWLWPGLAVAAAAVVAFAAGALLIGDDDDGGGQRSLERVADVELTASDLGGAAAAEGAVYDAGAGYSINIDVSGLQAAPEGEYYEGWLCNETTGDCVSVGTFHMRGGDGRVVLWSGVPVADNRQLVVTSAVEGSTGEFNGEVLLSGQLQDR
jgi:hypothetical protein